MTSDNKSPWFYPIPKSTIENLLNPTASAVGDGFGGLASFIMNPLMKLGVINQHNLENFEKKMIEKNNDIPEENRDDSRQGLALKALEDSIYQLDSDDLQEMFSTLIASTLDKQRNQNVLPSFSTILKDFSVTDARLFEKLYKLNAVTKVDLKLVRNNPPTTLPVRHNIILLDDGQLIYEPVSVNTLARLGLIEISSNSLVQPEYQENYRRFKNKANNHYRYAERQLDNFRDTKDSFDSVDTIEGYITMTELGKQFGSVVINQ